MKQKDDTKLMTFLCIVYAHLIFAPIECMDIKKFYSLALRTKVDLMMQYFFLFYAYPFHIFLFIIIFGEKITFNITFLSN